MESFTPDELILPQQKYECTYYNINRSKANILFITVLYRFGPHRRRTVSYKNLLQSDHTTHPFSFRIHAWGDSLKETFEQCGIAMFGYMTELPYVEIKQTAEIEATGHDLESLLYHFLDELLFLFCCEPYLVCSKVSITEFSTEGEELRIRCKCYGEEFQIGKHPQCSEVKAITYSAMQIVNEPERSDFQVFVIVDI